MNKDNILKKGNDSIAIAGIWGISAAAFTCPLCIVAGSAFLVNGVRQKLSD